MIEQVVKKQKRDTNWYDDLILLCQRTKVLGLTTVTSSIRNIGWDQMKGLVHGRVHEHIRNRKLLYDRDLCYDKETQIITKSGLKFVKDVTLDDEIMTLNNSGYIEFQHPVRVIKKFEEKLLHFLSRRIDLKVTEDQDLFVGCKAYKNNKAPAYFKPFDFVAAGDINNKLIGKQTTYFVKKNGGLWEGSIFDFDELLTFLGFKISNKIRENFVKLLAWYLSEGNLGAGRIVSDSIPVRKYPSISYDEIAAKVGCNPKSVQIILSGYKNYRNVLLNGKETKAYQIKKFAGVDFKMISKDIVFKGGDYSIVISQWKNTTFREEIRNLIKSLGFSAKVYEGSILFRDKKIHNYLKQFGKSYEKFIPDCIKNLPIYYLKIFLETYTKGDGTFRDNNTLKSVVTASSRMKDDLLELLLKTNNSFSFGKTPSKMTEFSNKSYKCRDCWYIQIPEKKFERAYLRKASEVKYNDYVYDVTVPNRVIYVIRNGKGCWSSNCAKLFQESFFIYCKAVDIWDCNRKTKFLTFLGDILDQELMNIVRMDQYYRSRDKKLERKLKNQVVDEPLAFFGEEDSEKAGVLEEIKNLLENFGFETEIERDIVNTMIYGRVGDWGKLQRKSGLGAANFNKLRKKVIEKLRTYIMSSCSEKVQEILSGIVHAK